MSSPAKSCSRRRKACEVEVPSQSEDGAERKRVLNILANRRYRERRRELVRDLEKQVACSSLRDEPRAYNAKGSRRMAASALEDERDLNDVAASSGGSLALHRHASDLFNDIAQATAPVSSTRQGEDDLHLPIHHPTPTPATSLTPASQSVNRPASASTISRRAATSPSWVSSGFPSVGFNAPPGAKEGSDISAEFQTYETADHTFADETLLPLWWELKALRGFLEVAKRLRIDEMMWSLDALSPYTDSARNRASGATYEHLPSHLQPTETQLSIPHHPILDILPWPTVRSKLIAVFAAPQELRPPVASSPTALSDLVSDVEDAVEGVKLWGDPFVDGSWEIGTKFYKRWWFVFDRDAVRASNERRWQRGADPLGRGRVLGEV